MKSKNEKYIYPQKSKLRQISIADVNVELPDLKNIFEPKAVVIAKWMCSWIEQGLNSGKILVNDVIPSKADFAYLLGVSVGTMQNSFRQIEDLGYVESKQCVGTLVRDYTKPSSNVRKLTSKRELAAEAIKRYILSDGFKKGSKIPSSRTISTIINFSPNTTRMALDYLAYQGILEHMCQNPKDQGWRVVTVDFELKPVVKPSETETLVDMVVKDLEKYINGNLKIGDKIFLVFSG